MPRFTFVAGAENRGPGAASTDKTHCSGCAMPFIEDDIVVEQVGDKDFELVAPAVYQGNAQTSAIPATVVRR
jgi:hypothetical protein